MYTPYSRVQQRHQIHVNYSVEWDLYLILPLQQTKAIYVVYQLASTIMESKLIGVLFWVLSVILTE